MLASVKRACAGSADFAGAEMGQGCSDQGGDEAGGDDEEAEQRIHDAIQAGHRELFEQQPSAKADEGGGEGPCDLSVTGAQGQIAQQEANQKSSKRYYHQHEQSPDYP